MLKYFAASERHCVIIIIIMKKWSTYSIKTTTTTVVNGNIFIRNSPVFCPGVRSDSVMRCSYVFFFPPFFSSIPWTKKGKDLNLFF